VIATRGAAIVISSMAAYRQPPLEPAQEQALATAPSPGVIMTPLAQTELDSKRGPAFRTILDSSPARRAGTVDEVASLAAFITGGDFLMDGGVTVVRVVAGAQSAVQG
jgi:NAD(P)-dependent dehydrogenase (short-subunit alcohol dehydrogenase family)